MTPSNAGHRPSVIFDLGKVLVGFDFRICARKIHNRSGVDVEKARVALQESEHIYAFEAGLITPGEFYRRIRHDTGYDGTQSEFELAFADIFSPIPPMIDLQQSLRARGIRTYIFSNTNVLAVEHISRSFPFYRGFTGHILSFEHHVMKPDPRLYEVVERVSQCRGSDLVYFDDRPENVATALERNWRAFVHETPEKSLGIIRSLGL